MDTNPTVDELRMNEIQRLDAAAATTARGDAGRAFDVVPWLSRSIAEDAASGRFARWSRSTIVDENTGSPVLESKTVKPRLPPFQSPSFAVAR